MPLVPSHPVSEDAVEAIVGPLRSLTSGRHEPIFEAAKALARLGLTGGEVKSRLIGAVGSTREMKKKGKEAVDWLVNHRWFERR